MPLWTPGFAVSLAAAIAATAANKTTTAPVSSFADGDFIITSSLPVRSGGGWSAPWVCFSEARQEVAQVERFKAINGCRRTDTHLSAYPSRRSLAIAVEGSS